MIEPIVVINVISVIMAVLRPYFRQNIVPNDATGMAITTVLILFISGLTPHSANSEYMDSGTTASRRNDVMYTLRLPIISFRGNRAIDEPIIISAIGTVMFPTMVIGWASR